MNYLINVLHESFLQSRNADVQERATILLAHYLPHGILKNTSFFVNKVAPIALRGLRGAIEGEDTDRHRWLNDAATKIVGGLERAGFKWNQEMTNEMLSVNGLRTLFGAINNSQIDELVGNSYNCLIMIAKANEMISFVAVDSPR
jgi:hypothetical protein